jgi:hypothetical protein
MRRPYKNRWNMQSPALSGERALPDAWRAFHGRPKTPEGKARTLAGLQAGFQHWVAERRAQKAASLDDGAAR